jgi:hypothetical protein
MHIDFTVDVRAKAKARPKPKPPRASGVVPIVRALVLAHQIETAIQEGRAADYADVARQMGVTRARVTQIVALRYLAPDIQAFLLDADARSLKGIGEHTLRPVTQELDWPRQRHVFQRILSAREQGAEGPACPGTS